MRQSLIEYHKWLIDELIVDSDNEAEFTVDNYIEATVKKINNKTTKMNQIIDRVFQEFENDILGNWLPISIPICQKNSGWDLESEFEYSDLNGIGCLMENECTEDSHMKLYGNRYFINLEYKRENKGGNQPTREIYVGEFIGIEKMSIKIIGTKISFSEYSNNLMESIKKMEKLCELDDYKSIFIKKL